MEARFWLSNYQSVNWQNILFNSLHKENALKGGLQNGRQKSNKP